MNDLTRTAVSRRAILSTGALAAGMLVAGKAFAAEPIGFSWDTPTSATVVRPMLLRRAMASLQQHGALVRNRDRIAVVDFSLPSSQPRMFFVDTATGRTTSAMLVAHGSGSDPAHTGWLERFSNDPGSNASCQGAFLATDYYVGKHGRSQRIIGLDATNNNALDRNIVVHGAWYSEADMVSQHGMLGRSQGCFAVGESVLDTAFARLGQGRMIYAAKV